MDHKGLIEPILTFRFLWNSLECGLYGIYILSGWDDDLSDSSKSFTAPVAVNFMRRFLWVSGYGLRFFFLWFSTNFMVLTIDNNIFYLHPIFVRSPILNILVIFYNKLQTVKYQLSISFNQNKYQFAKQHAVPRSRYDYSITTINYQRQYAYLVWYAEFGV
jgi:hypothetical protein